MLSKIAIQSLAMAVSVVMSASVPSDLETALGLMNAERATHGLVPLLWNNNLASAATTWATYLKDTNQVAHASQEQRANQGEVLAHFSADVVDGNLLHPVTAATNTWLAGGVHYPAGGVIGDGSELWNHWAQLMWASTTEVGCGVAHSAINNLHQAFVVCRLTPEGNVVGQAPFPSEGLVNDLQPRQNLDPGPYTGDLTHFTTGLGACGHDDTGKGGILALSHLKMGAPSNNNPLCDRLVELQANGRTAYATVRDKCMGCAFEDVDASEDVFIALNDDLGIGRAPVTWRLL